MPWNHPAAIGASVRQFKVCETDVKYFALVKPVLRWTRIEFANNRCHGSPTAYLTEQTPI